MLKKPVAKYYIWRTAAAYFVVIFIKVPWQAASWCEDWDAAPKTDYKKINSNAHSQVLRRLGSESSTKGVVALIVKIQLYFILQDVLGTVL